MRPVIALTASLDLGSSRTMSNFSYEKMVTNAGGLPVTVAHTAASTAEDILEMADALLLTGGVDVHPRLYGELPVWEIGTICSPRDELEMALIPLFIRAGKPVMGICRGIQMLNVALGGTLWQDIQSQIPGSCRHVNPGQFDHPVHNVFLEPDSMLAKITGKTELWVNTSHHEAVKAAAPGLRVTARAADGVNEAVEGDKGFVLGLQWHPEGLDNDDAKAIFSAFVNAAREARK